MTTPRSDRVLNLAVGRPIDILLVEDSPSDVAMTVEAFREGHIANELHIVTDGEQALAYLRKQAPFTDTRRPDLVLLDLNLPKKDGREVLGELAADDDLKTIPIVVLTTSSAHADILRSYELHANAYVTKPVGVDEFFAAIRGIEDFWLSVVRLPGKA
jgi:two-component system, chemotaxis family, response regulator Rcp1